MPVADVPALAASDCTAVLLPGAELLGAEQPPPARELADAGAVCVLATDLNPGTSPIASLPLIAGLAVRRYNWSIKETLLALTLNAAWVLGCSAEIGALEPGRRADVLLLDAPVSHLPYRLGHNPVAAAIVGGAPRLGAPRSRLAFRGGDRMSAPARPEIPAMVNVHSHAFQRDLRGIAERPSAAANDDFWSWRTAMFDAVARLDPDSMHTVALAVYKEMARRATAPSASSITSITSPMAGRTRSPTRWRSRLRMPRRRRASRSCCCQPPTTATAGVMGRTWSRRPVSGASATPTSTRSWSGSMTCALGNAPERGECRDRGPLGPRGSRPLADSASPSTRRRTIWSGMCTRRSSRSSSSSVRPSTAARRSSCSTAHGFLGPRTTVVHAIHVNDGDVARVASSHSMVAACPTTEANLGDGFLPALRYRDAGVPLTIGSRSNVRVDPFEEVRELETLARREGLSRDALLARTATSGVSSRWPERASLGVSGRGVLQIDTDHPAIRGVSLADLPYAIATCAEPGVIAHADREGITNGTG